MKYRLEFYFLQGPLLLLYVALEPLHALRPLPCVLQCENMRENLLVTTMRKPSVRLLSALHWIGYARDHAWQARQFHRPKAAPETFSTISDSSLTLGALAHTSYPSSWVNPSRFTQGKRQTL
jgi:hypothetical protein